MYIGDECTKSNQVFCLCFPHNVESILNKTYLHKFKMAAIGHFTYLAFHIVHLDSDVIPSL